MPLVAEALMCHAPIVIPPIGGSRRKFCEKTTHAMLAAATTLVRAQPQLVVVFSPHTPRLREAFGLWASEIVTGDFSRFGHANVRLEFTNGWRAFQALVPEKEEVRPLPAQQELDHGATVPLWFLQEAGYRGEVAVVAFPYETSRSRLQKLGQVLCHACEASALRVALLYSGDMSHCLTQQAPVAFHPAGQRFDNAVVAMVQSGSLEFPSFFTEEFAEMAAEDMTPSLTVAAAVAKDSALPWEFLSYEGPFGVGYLVASRVSKS